MTPGVLGHLLLGLLSRSEQTGYELTRAFDTTLKNVWGASHSQIYPELAKLEGRGLIRKTTAGPRGSQRYAVTAEGLGELERWLAGTQPIESPRLEWMARVFFLGLLPHDRALAYLRAQGAFHRAKLAVYEGYAAGVPPAGARSWDRIALEARMRFERAMIEWAAWAVDLLGEEPPS